MEIAVAKAPHSFCVPYGTAEAVPCYKTSRIEFFSCVLVFDQIKKLHWVRGFPGLKSKTSTPSSKNRSLGTPESWGTRQWCIIMLSES
jgi:hypothetical protein